MKNLLSLIAITSFLLACNSTSINAIEIKDFPPGEQPELKLENYETGDVEIHRTGSPEGSSYEIIYFHNYSGKLQDYRALYVVPETYDNAQYNWENDTSVTVTLVNSETQNKYTLHLFGNGSSSGMRIDE